MKRVCILLVVALSGVLQFAQAQEEKVGGAKPADVKAMTARGVAFLKASQEEDGSFSPQLGPGVSAMATYALMCSGLPTSDPDVAQGLQYLEKQIQPDGGMYGGRRPLENYETSLAIMCFHEANRDGKYDALISKATQFLKGLPWNATKEVGTDDARYGGVGYGADSRPDLSNTGMFIDALETIGTDDNDPAIQEAIKFVSNCQNFAANNTTKFASLIEDGGFYYTPVGDGESKAGTEPNGGLRSYGSMTYIGFKSLLYAGVDRDDPRVRSARQWIVDHYTLDENPGVKQDGLYYFYHIFAKALAANGEKLLTDSKGQNHDWRQDLVAALAKRQRDDGSWVNESDRYFEGDPALVTSFSLLALAQCRE